MGFIILSQTPRPSKGMFVLSVASVTRFPLLIVLMYLRYSFGSVVNRDFTCLLKNRTRASVT